MNLSTVFAILSLTSLFVAWPGQPKPDFSGHWLLIEPKTQQPFIGRSASTFA